MNVEDIKVAAYNWREFPPDDLGLPERYLWLAFANVYKRFRDGELTKEQGEELKLHILTVYENDKAKLDRMEKLVAHHAKLWKNIEVAGIRYNQARTVEAADAFVNAVYGVGLKPKEPQNE